jgi:acyl carrier protein
MHTTLSEVADLVREQTGTATTPISAETRLERDLRMNSAQVVDLLSRLEERFDCVVEDEDLEAIDRVGDLAAIVDRAGTS